MRPSPGTHISELSCCDLSYLYMVGSQAALQSQATPMSVEKLWLSGESVSPKDTHLLHLKERS